MFKKFIFALAIISSFVFSTSKIRADNNYAIDSTVSFKVDDSGNTLVSHSFTLENLTSDLYATTYTLTLQDIAANNVSAVDDKGNAIPFQVQNNGTSLDIKLTFADAVAGRGQTRHFTISYENSSLAVKTGDVWEVSIPRLSDNEDFRNYQVDLFVPDSFGQEAYISPQPTNRNDDGNVKSYVFSGDVLNQTGVTAGFGQFQVFSFNLLYHLKNGQSPCDVNSCEIAFPPDTAYQKVYFTSVVPKPSSMRIDSDGNYLATYKMLPDERIDVNVEGSVQIFAGYRSFSKPTNQVLENDLLPTKNYWQVDDPQIKLLAENLKTPEAIYNFVSTKLKYDFSRVQPDTIRLGAVGALESPTQAICMEFTDLFVAIARAAGIPAREINGYAYTDNKQLEPLSLVADVLHAWPEYYDQTKGVWVPVDPTWGSTSGQDYFNKLDLRHFAFVIHGANDTTPYPPGSYKLGPNPQKDVFVSFGQLPANRNSIPQITITTDRNIPFLATLYTANVYNPGPSTLYAFYPSIYFDGVLHSREFVPILPPFATFSTQVSIPYSILGKNIPDDIKITVNESQINLATNKSQIVINSLLVLFAAFILLIVLVLIKLKKINLNGITGIITSIHAKFSGKSPKNPNSQESGPPA